MKVPSLLFIFFTLFAQKELYAHQYCGQLLTEVPDAHIIVIDDQEPIRKIIGMLFSSTTKIKVHGVSNLAEALEIIRSGVTPIVGVIVDKNLGTEDGIKVANEISSLGIASAICTGDWVTSVETMGLPVIRKPVNREAIEETMELFARAYLSKQVAAFN